MKRLKSGLDVDVIFEAVQRLSFWLDGSGAEMAIAPNGGIPNEVSNDPGLKAALEEIARLRNLSVLHIMVNKMKPNVRVPIHRDFLLPTPLQKRNHPTIERWHLPIVTNDDCTWWDEVSGIYRMKPGFWHGPVPYWLKHQVTNDGQTERIHLVIDLDTPDLIGEYLD
jgi:hypothetical protein